MPKYSFVYFLCILSLTRNMCYKNPIDRIKITRKPILL